MFETDFMNDHKSILYKAALLHDVGKFWQRSESVRGKHPKHSGIFVEKWLQDDLVRFIVEHHHAADLKGKNQNLLWYNLASIVCEADNLASGERQEENLMYRRPLESVFNQISFRGKKFDKKLIQPIGRLRPDNQYPFPEDFDRKDEAAKMAVKVNYADQWWSFQNEAAEMPGMHEDTLLHFYKKYLWCVPSAYFKSVPDISLYEHSRLTAAIARCLYNSIAEKSGNDPAQWAQLSMKDYREKKCYRLVCAELSGIQKYIYNIAHSGAMRALKGRSFWLQQIVDSVASHLLEKFNLPLANLIFAGGGKLIVLLPNTDEVKENLPKIQSDIEGRVFEEYDGNISLVFGEIELMGNDFFGRKISGKWNALYKKVEENKTRKLAGQFKPEFFKAGDLYGDIQQCNATKREICRKEDLKKGGTVFIGAPKFTRYNYNTPNKTLAAYGVWNDETTETDKIICEEQFRSQDVGYEIRKGKQIGIFKTDKSDFDVLGLNKIGFLGDDRKDYGKHLSLLLHNDDDFLNELKNQQIPKGWKFYGGDWVPLKSGTDSTREFDEIISDAMGIERLGVLRMDVDNLGEIFKGGLGENATFSRIVQLSAMLDFFFSGYLNVLKEMCWTVGQGIVSKSELTEAEALALDVEDDKSAMPLRDILQIVYAGGDDLFIVSTWNVLPDLAWWIKERFEEFTCKNPCFTLSAGIALFDNKYPVYKAAKYAGQALDDAKGKWKDKNGKEHEKGRISFLGKAMSWRDFEISRHLAKELYSTTGQLKRGLVSRLEEMYDNYYSVKQQLKWLKKYQPDRVRPFEKAEYSKWRWRGCYSLSRFAEQVRRSEAKDKINQLAADIFTSQYHLEDNQKSISTDTDFITFLDVPVRWADLLIRTKK
ncbi:MAG: type III-A CRISPR-associated protein Cas10/Csm1 [Saprospiraceae bacterium]|nr:MAG: type III-A CRISPR-associated protein Cas10/Csm1 [Saprospiraceae bacterium]